MLLNGNCCIYWSWGIKNHWLPFLGRIINYSPKHLYDMEEINYHEFINLRLLDTRNYYQFVKIFMKQNTNPPSMKQFLKERTN